MVSGINGENEIQSMPEVTPQVAVVQSRGQRICSNIRFFFNNITVEPVLVFFLLPSVMSMIAIANLGLEKACRVNLKLEESICDGLSLRNSSMYNKTDEQQVQKLVASMTAWKNVIKSVIPSLLLMFLGSWSDRHSRRKPCMILPITGEIVSGIGMILCTVFFYQLPMQVNGVVESLPTALTGGWFTMHMAVFSYVSAISSVETRTVRIGAVNIVNHLSLTIGIALSGLIYQAISFYGVFGLALVMQIGGLFFVIFVVKEAPSKTENSVEVIETKLGYIKDFFNIKHVADTLRVAFKKRPGNWRTRICVIMVLVMLIMGPLQGELSVIYLFGRYRFGWDEVDFGLYYAYNLVLHMIGTIFSLSLFSKFLKLDDALLGMISSTSKVLSCFVYAFAPNTTIFYLGVVVEILNGTSFIALRSIISKLVPPEELGKINSLFGVCDAMMPLVYAPLYSLVYKSTMNVLPGAFFLVGGILTFPAILIFFWLYLQHRRDAKELAKDEPQMDNLLKTQ